MAVRYSIFPSVNSDRVYYAEDFLARPDRDLLANGGDGVSRNVGDRMEVVETSPPSMAVNVSTGACRGQGWRCEIEGGPETLPISAADPNDERFDNVVVEFDHDNREATVKVVEGQPGGSTPSVIRTSSVHQLVLAVVTCPAAASSISGADILDARFDSGSCGWLRSQLTFRPVDCDHFGSGKYEFRLGEDIEKGDVFALNMPAGNSSASPTLENTDGGPSGPKPIVIHDASAYQNMWAKRPHRFWWSGTNYVLLDPIPQ